MLSVSNETTRTASPMKKILDVSETVSVSALTASSYRKELKFLHIFTSCCSLQLHFSEKIIQIPSVMTDRLLLYSIIILIIIILQDISHSPSVRFRTSEIYESIWTLGRTPWMGDRPDARTLPTQDNTT
jgi:hypothetical protein